MRDAADATAVPGRLQLVDVDPLTVLDGAHNPARGGGARRVAAREFSPADRLAVVLGVLEDKDAARMLARAAGVCERAWFTAPPSARALSPAALQSLARQLGFEAVACEPRAVAGARRGAALGARRGGAVLVTGSVYLVGDLLRGLTAAGTLSWVRGRLVRDGSSR